MRWLHRQDWLSPVQWRRRILLWTGALVVGLVTIVFVEAAKYAYQLFYHAVTINPWWPMLITPCAFGLLTWLTRGSLQATRGSGIPEAIATLDVEDGNFRHHALSLRIAAGKMLLTLSAFLTGASVGREGPTVHVGASLMYTLGRRFGFSEPAAAGRFILAGAAAGLSAAFNAPLAGVMFAIEEMAGAYEHRMSGIILTAVVIAGVVTLGTLGNYSYFGQVTANLPLSSSWMAVLATGVLCGLAGGIYARMILLDFRPLSKLAGLRKRWPVMFSIGCGIALVLLSRLAGDSLYGTGYAQARAILQQQSDAPGAGFGALKLMANVASYWANIPGGLFSPALAVGAGLGHNLSLLITGAPASAIVLLSMAAYLSGVTQSPLTSTVICMELTSNQTMVIPILATCLLARTSSQLVCRTPVYRAFANRIIEQYREQQLAKSRATLAAATRQPGTTQTPS
ncbi:MAG TPA: chloride channel protein [Oleiagrimonas sp.]|nr:chloride channel protein [Oleiagrimonas sp.]